MEIAEKIPLRTKYILRSTKNHPNKELKKFFEDDIPVISIVDAPPDGSWLLTPLYHVDALREIRIWQIGFDATENMLKMKSGMIRTEGYSYPTSEVKENKSGRSIKEQAILEAKKRYNDKYIEDFYRTSIQMEYEEIMFKASSGHPYEEKKVRKWPVAVQVKLDGFRMLCHESSKSASGIKKRSRENREFKHIKHFDKEIDTFFKYLPSGSVLDGELYNINYSRNRLQSIIETKKDRIHELLPTVKYYLFDLYWPENPPYEHRYNRLLDCYQKYLSDGGTSDTFEIIACNLCYTHEEVAKVSNYFTGLGFEGGIIRQLAGEFPSTIDMNLSIYQQKKSNSILKFKTYFDTEGRVVEVYEGTGTEKGKVMFRVEGSNGKVFGVRPRGKFKSREEMFKNKDKYIGRIYTYRYFELSEYGIPIMPTGIGFRDFVD